MSLPPLHIKVCGMRDHGNIADLVALAPNYLGFIFFPGSSRFLGKDFQMPEIPHSIKKTGVFVNEELELVSEKVRQYGLNAVQLHGEETPAYCEDLKKDLTQIEVIKAFRIREELNTAQIQSYAGPCDTFLFDTKGKLYGGTGKKFNWDLLKNYEGETPFFLSGGLGPDDLPLLQAFAHPAWKGIDLNSGFETAPAFKDIEKLKTFISKSHAIHSK